MGGVAHMFLVSFLACRNSVLRGIEELVICDVCHLLVFLRADLRGVFFCSAGLLSYAWLNSISVSV